MEKLNEVMITEAIQKKKAMEATLHAHIIQVTNVAPAASIEQMKELFGYLGKIKNVKLYPTETYLLDPQSKVCYVEYAESWSVGVAQHLTNTVFIDRALIVIPIVDTVIPDEAKALTLIDSGLQGFSSGLSPVINEISGIDGTLVITTIDPRLTALGLPQYPPLPANMDPSKIEEIRRTVYMGNLSPIVTADKLLNFVNQIGEVKYVRMAGEENQPTRFAFVEFSDQTSVANALQYNGVLFEGRPLKVNHSNNAIVKPQPKSLETAQKEIEEAMKRVKEAQSLITAAIEPESEKKKSRRSRSRSTSRHRSSSRSRRKRSRSRSKGSRSRRRSRSGHRSSHRRSRSSSKRSKKDKSRSRSRDKRKSPSPRRRKAKSRSRSRDRKKRHRSRSRSVSRSKSPSKSRSSKSSKSKESSKSDKKSRDKSPSKEKSSKKELGSKSESKSAKSSEITPNGSAENLDMGPPILTMEIPHEDFLAAKKAEQPDENEEASNQGDTSEKLQQSGSDDGANLDAIFGAAIKLLDDNSGETLLAKKSDSIPFIDNDSADETGKAYKRKSAKDDRSRSASPMQSPREPFSKSPSKSPSKASSKRESRSGSKVKSVSPGNERSRSRSKKRSRSHSKKRSRSRDRKDSPHGKKRDRSRSKRSRSRSKKRSRSRSKRRSTSPRKSFRRKKSRSPISKRKRSRSGDRRYRSRSGTRSTRRGSPSPRRSKRRSPTPKRYSRSPKRHSITPRRRSRHSRSPRSRRSRSRSFRKKSRSPRLSRSPVHKRSSRRSSPRHHSRSRSRSSKRESKHHKKRAHDSMERERKQKDASSERDSGKEAKVFRNYDEEEKGYDSGHEPDAKPKMKETSADMDEDLRYEKNIKSPASRSPTEMDMSSD